ncbi:MAG TPA: NAD(P)-binding domain-containing protein [Actinocrinis sp.]|nr:NAD(P)-binding domain-containing protein [Actinocrinis sp.]
MIGNNVDIAVIGAGPYGLSAFTHLSGLGLRARIFGKTMDTWKSHMPVGMYLKSTPRASSIAAGRPGYTLADFCMTVGTTPLTGDDPVPLDLFLRYGEWFAEQLVPAVEPATVRRVDRVNSGFRIETSTGECFEAKSVLVASGLIEHAYIPPELADLASTDNPAGAPVSHSSQHTDMSVFAGRDVAVVGAGQSALESAALLFEAGARPIVLARRSPVQFNTLPDSERGDGRRGFKPDSPLGPGWSLFACSRAPALFRRLPDHVRLDLVARILGPSGAWWLRERVLDRIGIHTGQRIMRAVVEGSRVALHVVTSDGAVRAVSADHVLSATGYRIGADNFAFLGPELRRSLARLRGWPRLGAGFESSVPGLFFVGFPAAASYGPLMRFVCGTGYAASRVSQALAARSL